jgi:starch synthase
MKLLMAVAEVAPYVTTGGLGNAVAGLAAALAGRGHDVTVVIPGYEVLGLDGDDREWHELGAGPPRVLAFRDDAAFGRPGVYGPVAGTGYDDNWWRFGRFAEAVSGLSAGYDVLHLHDAHVAAAAVTAPTPAVLTIHNAAFQLGGHLDEALAVLGPAAGGVDPAAALRWWEGGANYLKGGIVAARRVTTVSPTHAVELTRDPTSFGLADVFRSLPQPLVGILNGIDTTTWDPGCDPALPARFSVRSLHRRRVNKEALLERTGLDDGILWGNVGRMSHQKGLSLIRYYLGGLVDEGFRLVLVGNGELDDMVDGWAAQYPGAIAHLPYEESLARLVSGGADAYLMPSEFEPSGLGQLYAMRYGCPALGFATGGLADSIVDVDEDPARGNGFLFRTFNAEEFTKAVRRAMRYRGDIPRLWRELQARGMETDWSWDARAAEYEAVFASAIA